MIMKKMLVELVIEKFITSLSKENKKIITIYLSGLKIVTIAKILRLSSSCIFHRIQIILYKFKCYLNLSNCSTSNFFKILEIDEATFFKLSPSRGLLIFSADKSSLNGLVPANKSKLIYFLKALFILMVSYYYY